MQIRVSCPGCGTRFRLDESKVPPEGFRTTCSVCSAVIAIEPLPHDATAPSPSGDRPPAPKPRPQPTDAGASPSPAPQPANPPPRVTTPPEPPPEVTTPPGPPPEVPHQVVHHGSREELLELALDALSQRRKMASEMNTEHVRLREVVEQQQAVVSRLVDAVSQQIPKPSDTAQAEGAEKLRARQEELIKKLLEAERERLEMASKMARELSGLREVVEQQQRVVTQLVDTVSTKTPAPLDAEQAEGNKRLLVRQEQLLEKMLDSERERRDMAAEMSRKLFGFREVVEQQQRVVSRLVDGVSTQIPAPPGTGQAEGSAELARQEDLEEGLKAALDRKAEGNEELVARQDDLEEELQRLKTALDSEKEIVDRLRRGKLDLERRATEAEATIEDAQKHGFIKRLLKRDDDD